MSVKAPNFLTCPAVPQLTAGRRSFSRPQKKPRRRRGWVWLIVFLTLVVVAALVTPLVYGIVRAGRAAQGLQASIRTVQDRALAYDFAGAESGIGQAETNIIEMQAGLSAIGSWRYVPYVDIQVAALDQALTAGQTTLSGMRDLIEVAKTVSEALSLSGTGLDTGISPTDTYAHLTTEQKRQIMARMDAALPQMRQARDKLDIALGRWQAVSQEGVYPPVKAQLEQAVEKLTKMKQPLDQMIAFAEILLPMAGYPSPKDYLILLQNSEELRPTGGFIGTVGYAHVDAANLQDMWFKDVYDIDRPVQKLWKDVPPVPLQRWLEQKAWFLRDGNWSPDFPQTAEHLIDVYERETAMANATSTPINGVIALQPGFFRDLLRITGPIQIEDQTFDADNFYDKLQYSVEIGFVKNGTPVPQRKELVAKIGTVLIEKLMSQPSARWTEILEAMTQALDRKDILMYVRDADVLALLDGHRWSGRIQSAPDDYLWVVDANLDAWKTDGVMDKKIVYARNETGSGTIATVSLQYHNTNLTPDWRYIHYRDYVRVYVPEGSELLSSEGAMDNDVIRNKGVVVPGTVDVYNELGKTVFGAFWSIEPGESRELRFTYRLPAVHASSSTPYQLFVQKQPGSNTHLTLDLSFGKTVKSATPAEDPKEYGDMHYRTSLDPDRDMEVDVKF